MTTSIQIHRISPEGVEVHRFGLDESEIVPADVIVEVRQSDNGWRIRESV
jgi:hypothetical protein